MRIYVKLDEQKEQQWTCNFKLNFETGPGNVSVNLCINVKNRKWYVNTFRGHSICIKKFAQWF